MSIYFTYLLGVLGALLGIVGAMGIGVLLWLGVAYAVEVYDRLFIGE